ncbi:MAG: AAA family ATPase [Salinirussus sp.]
MPAEPGQDRPMTIQRTVVEATDEMPAHGIGLSAAALGTLGADAGDVIAVAGAERSAGVAVVLDDEAGVRLPDRIRDNAGVDPGERVELEAVPGPAAASVSFRLAESFDVTRAENALRQRLDGVPVTVGDRIEAALLGGALTLDLTVTTIEPASPAVVGDDTEINIVGDDHDVVASPSAGYDDVAWADPIRTELRRLVAVRFDRAGEFEALDRSAGAGVLLHGPAGVGKRTLVEAVAAETDATFVPVPVARLIDGNEDRLERVQEAANGGWGRVLVLLDGIDAVGDDRPGLVARIERLVDDLRESGAVVVATGTDPGGLPDGLRRGGRLDREFELGALDHDQRRAVLYTLLDDVPLAAGADPDAVAKRTHGFVAADIGTVVDRAVEQAVARDDRTAVRGSDFERALEAVEPSGLRDMAVEFPAVSWDDVGGLAEAKREVVRAVHWPLEYPEFFERAGVDPPRGVLLYGPPGTGKTLLARAAASISNANFVSVKGPELLDRYVGASEQAVRELFRTARQNAPTVIFFDEVDAISPERRDGDSGVSERVVSQLLTELDGLEPLEDVIVIAATNRPEMIDDALLRPGRLEKTVETPLPDREARREILEIHLREMPLEADVDVDGLADRTEGFSGGDIAALAREAAMLAIELTVTDDRDITVGADQFEAALERIEPSVPDDRREQYAAFENS